MQLSGVWLAAEADDDVRRNGIGLDSDDSGWSRISVPGHWQDHEEFSSSDGPIMYRHAFSAAPPAEGRRRWIALDGIFYQADVWLDGAYLGDPEGYFFSHSFDVTSLSRFGHDHVLAVEVTCSPQHGTAGRRNITGVFQTPGGDRPEPQPRRTLATGHPVRDRPRAHGPTAGAVPRRRHETGSSAHRDAHRQRPVHTGDDANPGRRHTDRRATPDHRCGPERLRVDDRHRRPPSLVGRGYSATSRSPRSPSRSSSTAR
jgi:hypothetical protein